MKNCKKIQKTASGKADMHIHTAFSDGTDLWYELIDILRQKNITLFSVTDHDNVDFYKALKEKGEDVSPSMEGLTLIPGIEFSCRTEVSKCHILGYGIDVENSHIEKAINKAMEIRSRKLSSRLDFLEKEHGIALEDKEIEDLSRMNSVGKPHIARLLVAKGYGRDIGDAITKYLTGIPRNSEDRIDAAVAIDAIRKAGGIPVWAHPLGGEGEKRLAPDRLRLQLHCLVKAGVQGVEYYYSRYTPRDRSLIDTAMADTPGCGGLLLSGGSDYHGKVKNIQLGELSPDGEYASPGQLTILKKLCPEANI